MSPRLDLTEQVPTSPPEWIGVSSTRNSGPFAKKKKSPSLRHYVLCFVAGMVSATLAMRGMRPSVIPKTTLLASPHPHLAPVYYRVFVLDHPFYSPYHASPDDTSLGRFFLVDLSPPFTGQKVTNYLMKRESLDQSRTASLFANATSLDPVESDEIVILNRGYSPVGNPNQPLMLVLEGAASRALDWKDSVRRSMLLLFQTIASSPITFLIYFFICFPGLLLRWWALF